MKTYHKINTIYKRDPENRNKTLLEGQFSLPEFEYLKNNIWSFSEKVDGTNIRVLWNGHSVEFRGKTDNAQIPPRLLQALNETFSVEAFKEVFGNEEDFSVCLYGEGYGAKIQKGGGNYRQDNGFVLFDVLIDNWWLLRPNIEDIAAKLKLNITPIIGRGTLADMVEMCSEGFPSAWGGKFRAEGIVARPEGLELFNRRGERIITKLKCKDFAR